VQKRAARRIRSWRALNGAERDVISLTGFLLNFRDTTLNRGKTRRKATDQI